jgi:serine/threonine-protein kinase
VSKATRICGGAEREVVVADRVERIVAQVCGSLQEAHEKGFVHGNLKPASIYLITGRREVDDDKILGFGDAKRSDGHERPTQHRRAPATPA